MKMILNANRINWMRMVMHIGVMVGWQLEPEEVDEKRDVVALDEVNNRT